MNSPTTPTTDQLEAELAVLDLFDVERDRLGHDYGNGQRRAELGRRRGELRRAGGMTYPEPLAVDRDALRAAWERIAEPRIRRITLREGYRRATPATRRTLDAWEATRAELEAAEARR